jgi:RHS repeat-associated protein
LVLRDHDTNGDGTLDERLYIAQDANYNVVALFDNSGNVVERYVYDPFGQVTVLDANWSERAGSAFGWLYLHQGGRLDATSGLYHFRHRDYSPTLGRWTRLDPIRYLAGDVNLYRALGNDLVNRLDPLGLADWELKWEWHHMFPQEFRNQFPDFDFDAPENGRMIRGGSHRGQGGLHPSGWNEDWAEWIKEQKRNRRPITPESIREQAEKMMNSDKYKRFFEESNPATERWNVRADRLAREKAAKEEAEKAAKKTTNEAAEKGIKKVGKKGLKAVVSKAGGPVTGVLFFAYDWYDTGSFGGAINEAVWPLSELWRK